MTNQYATAEETAAVMRQPTPNEQWLYQQLDRIDIDRHEMGSAGDTPALVKLVFELRDENGALKKHYAKLTAQYVEVGAENARLRTALEGVIRVADRKTDEFDAARSALENKPC